jgi:hypothetical protein
MYRLCICLTIRGRLSQIFPLKGTAKYALDRYAYRCLYLSLETYFLVSYKNIFGWRTKITLYFVRNSFVVLQIDGILGDIDTKRGVN